MVVSGWGERRARSPAWPVIGPFIEAPPLQVRVDSYPEGIRVGISSRLMRQSYIGVQSSAPIDLDLNPGSSRSPTLSARSGHVAKDFSQNFGLF